MISEISCHVVGYRGTLSQAASLIQKPAVQNRNLQALPMSDASIKVQGLAISARALMLRNRGFHGENIVASALNLDRSGRYARQRPIHPSHINTCGPATSRPTCSGALPQKEQ